MKSFLALLFIGIYTHSFSQNYIPYFKANVKAQKAILDSNYTKAVQIYDTVFHQYEFVFAENCYTAAQTAIVAKDFNNAFYFIKRGFRQGITLEMVSNDSLLVQLKRKQQWESTKNKYDSLHQIYLNNINWKLRHCIDSLDNLDQKWRNKHETHPWNFLWRPFIWHKWKKVTKHIVEDTLVELIKKYGYPGGRLIGFSVDTLPDGKLFQGLSASACLTIFKHYYSVPRNLYINSLIEKQVVNGFLTPDDYATIIDFETKWGKQKYYQGLPTFQYFSHFPIDYSKDMEIIEKNRKAIGLGTIGLNNRLFKRSFKIGKLKRLKQYGHIYLFKTYYDSLKP